MKAKKAPAKTEEKFWHTKSFAYLMIGVTAIGIYLPALSFSFSPLDDQWAIANRMDLYTHWSSLKIFFSEPTLASYYRPVWISSHIPDRLLFGEGPRGFHLANIIYHALASLLAYRCFLRINIPAVKSFFLALLFAVHPISAQAVAWIPGRTEILLAIFSFLAFIYFDKYIAGKETRNLFISAIAFVLAALTKESAIVIPFLLACYALLLRKTDYKQATVPFTSFFLITLAWLMIRHHIVPSYPKLTAGNLFPAVRDFCLAILIYLGKIFLPVNQAIMPTVRDTPLLPVLIAILVVAVAVVRLKVQDKKIAMFGIAWFTLFITPSVMAGSTNGNWEHYEQRAYLPLAGMLIFISQVKLERLNLLYPSAVALGIAAVLSVKTIVRSYVYKDPYEFARAGIAESPSQSYFYIILGKMYADARQFRPALTYFNTYIARNPGRALGYQDKGIVSMNMEKYEDALACFTTALRITPGDPDLYLKRSDAYGSLGKWDSAWADLQKAKSLNAEMDPEKEHTAQKMMAARREVKKYTSYILGDSASDHSYNMRGIAHYILGELRPALTDFNSALRLNPDNVKARYNRGSCYEALGKNDSAYSDYRRLSEAGNEKGREALEKLISKISKPSENSQR